MGKKKVYFKIIELPEHQVLISKEQDENVHSIDVTFHLDDIKLNYKLGYKQKDIDYYFDKFDEKIAQGFIDSALETLNG